MQFYPFDLKFSHVTQNHYCASVIEAGKIVAEHEFELRTNYEQAVRHYQQSMEIEEELGNKGGIAATLGQLGLVYEERDEDYSAALEKYLLAYSIFRELNSPDAEIAVYLISRLEKKMGKKAFRKAVNKLEGRFLG